MIRKISETSYIKRLERMTMQERREYMNRVGTWLREERPLLARRSTEPMAMVQSIVQLGAAWNEREQQAFATGAQLLTALMGMTDTWLPDNLYKMSAKRSINHMAECLFRLTVGTLPARVVSGFRPQISSNGAAKKEPAEKAQKGTQAVAGNSSTHPTERKGAAAHYNPGPNRAAGAVAASTHGTPIPSRGGTTQPSALSPQTSNGLKPVRPKHIDQYVHLLPKATQERAAMVKDLLTELDASRENARRLMEAGEHSDKIELWARKATRLDNAVKAIYRELDAEWDKIVKQGRVVVDDLGNAHVVPGGTVSGDMFFDERSGKAGRQVSSEPVALTEEQKKRRRALRKYLVDTRRGNGKTREEHLQKWHDWWREYITIEPIADAMADETILAAAKHYGIDLASIETKDKK